MNVPVRQVSLGISDAQFLEAQAHPSASVKRMIDLCICVLVAPIVLPLALLIALALALEGGDVLYSQPRVGENGREFDCLKFRSMVRNADKRLQELLEKDSAAREEWDRYQKLSDDPRITWFGRFLRAYSLDELPQFINVLRGDMSIIGPRPIMVDQIELYGDRFGDYCAMKPGITGLWQVSGRNNHPFCERVQMDTLYISNWSVAGDMMILLRTLPAVLAGRGAR